MTLYNVFSLTRDDMETWLASQHLQGNHAARARHLFREIYRRGVGLPKDLVGIHKEILQKLQIQFSFDVPLRIKEVHHSSSDGSVKLVMELTQDSLCIETVLIPERNHLTQCLSTQVGCAQACRFCSTGRMGLLRNLSTEEIVGQVIAAERWRKSNECPTSLREYDQVRNIVYMGMGEPLDNLENVLKSTKIFMDGQGLCLSPNRITVSTVGLLPQLGTLLSTSPVAVALSLHSPFDEERSRLMPVNLRSPIANVLDCMREQNSPLAPGKKRSFFIQYTLIRGVNDSDEHAAALADLLHNLSAKINLIPLNEHSGTAMRRPDLGRIYLFQKYLKSRGFVTTVRVSKGRDIAAACGQLIKKETHQNERAAI